MAIDYAENELTLRIDAAVAAEREACAKIADANSGGVGGMSAALVAQLIRARSEKAT